MLRIQVRHRGLASALVEALSEVAPDLLAVSSDRESRDVVVSTVEDLSPTACRALTRNGAVIVMLAVTPTEAEHEAYLDAGAHTYLEMHVNNAALVAAIRAAVKSAESD